MSPTPALTHLEIDPLGFAWLSEEDIVSIPRPTSNPVRARVMHAAQQSLAASAIQEMLGVPAWKSRPCWFPGERMVTVTGV